MSRAKMLDRIHRLIAKNAAALGEEIRLEVVSLPGGRVRIGYRGDIERRPGENTEPITYASVHEAYRAALFAHIRAHHVLAERRWNEAWEVFA